MELNSAVGTFGDEKKEEAQERLIAQLSQYPEALNDYREMLKEKGMDTKGFRPTGNAEARWVSSPGDSTRSEVEVKTDSRNVNI